MATIVVPQMSQVFSRSEAAYAAMNELRGVIDRRVEELRKQLWAENAQLNEQLRQLWIGLKEEATATARQAVLDFAKSVWDGEAGQGVLVVIGQDRYSAPEGEPYYRLGRVVDFSEEQRFAAELSEVGFLPLNCFRGMLRAKSYIDFVSYLRLEHGVFAPHVSGAFDHWAPELVEAALGEPSEEELRALYSKVQSWGEDYYGPRKMDPADQIRLFGAIARFNPGDFFFAGSCSHHSGDTTAQWVYLPTGRWAVVANYGGEHGSNTWCVGVLDQPNVSLDISGRSASCYIVGDEEGNKYPPTPEELEFLEKNFDVGQYEDTSQESYIGEEDGSESE